MSSGKVIYDCATCSKAIKGKEHFAICVLCQRPVHRKCHDSCISNKLWAVLRRTFNCTACKSGMATCLVEKEKGHSRPTNYSVEKRPTPVGQSCSTINGSFHLKDHFIV
jgi:hypothetical protein